MSNEKGLMRFSKGDIDAAVGVFFDGFSKIIIGASVLMGVLKMPSDFVFGKLVAAIGLTALIFLGWNTVLAQKTGKATGNRTITALPGGIAAGTFFIWLFAIMMPTYMATNDFVLAWHVGLWANIFHSLFNILCAFIIDKLLKKLPSAAIFSSLAGGALAWLIIATLADGFSKPIIILPALFILLTMYLAKIQIKGLSPAVLGIGVATLIAWVSNNMDAQALQASFNTVGFYFPLPHFAFLSGTAFTAAVKYLPMVLAFAFADVIAAVQAIEQAEAGGDHYNRRTVLLGVGFTNIIGAILGNPFIIGCYWGHPAWKKAKAGPAYTTYVGIIYFVLCLTGLVAIATAVLPSAATVVLIIFAGMNSTAQAFEVNNKKYYPAMALGVAIPIFELIWGKIGNAIDGTKAAIGASLQTAGVNFDISAIHVTAAELANAGLAQGFEPLAQGSMLIAIIFVSALCFVIDRKWIGAAVSFVIASISAFFGLIHAPGVGLNASPVYSLIYIVFAIIFFCLQFIVKPLPYDLQEQ